ncbi:type II toxin-antitoxin system HicB family antitoxin, partial [Thiohalorhabdus sp. Cl-TMA]
SRYSITDRASKYIRLRGGRQSPESLHLEGMLADGDPIPGQAPIAEHQKNPVYKDGTWALVEVDLFHLSGEVRRINVSLPERILAIIDRAAKEEGESRSGFLAHAALDYLGHRPRAR